MIWHGICALVDASWQGYGPLGGAILVFGLAMSLAVLFVIPCLIYSFVEYMIVEPIQARRLRKSREL